MNDTDAHENWKNCYRQLAPKLVLFARQYVRSIADAEDIVQSAFVRFWRKQPDAQPEHYPLLYTAVRTTALDLLRKDERRARREADPSAESFNSEPTFFQREIELREEAAELSVALQRLPESQREVLVLRIWGDLTFAQIAETLGDSINTVASRYRYALEAMRKILKPQEYERV